MTPPLGQTPTASADQHSTGPQRDLPLAGPGSRSEHRGVCPHDCPDTCSYIVTVEQGRATAIRGNENHDQTRGFLCHKVSRYLDRVYHPDRLLYPLRRVGPKGSGQFERTSWDSALDEIARRFADISRSVDGPQAILPYSYCGTMGKIQSESLDRRFFHALGASLLDRTICATAGAAGYALTMGCRIGMDPETFADSRLIINWGSNTAVTNSHLWTRMLTARRSGARIITIDPYRSLTAARSDLHLPIRVGTDGALALGMMHILFRDDLIDHRYVAAACHGTAELKARVLAEYPPDRVAGITGLSASQIEDLARDYATTRPAAIRINYGLQRHAGGGMAVRTIACLPALIGAWKDVGGGLLLSTSGAAGLNTQALQRSDLIRPGTRTINMNQLGRALVGELPGPPVRAVYVYNSNPAAVAPEQQLVLRGLQRDDLFTVVHEQFPTDTCDYADLVLPATTQLEHVDLHSAYGHYDIQLNLPAIAPVGESRPNTAVFRELARRLDLPAELFADDDLELARVALWEREPQQPPSLRGITVDRLRHDGPLRLNLPQPYLPFRDGVFPTPSGRCELASTYSQATGEDPLPHFVPPAECPLSNPELASRYPLQLLSPPSNYFLNSSFVNVESLRKSTPEPWLEMHADDAAARSLRDGQLVEILNDRGAFCARLVIADSVRPGLVVAPGIWWHKLTGGRGNANLTTSARLTDLGGGATFFDNLVEVRAAMRP